MASAVKAPLNSILKRSDTPSRRWRGSCPTLNLTGGGVASPAMAMNGLRGGMGGSTGNLMMTAGFTTDVPTPTSSRRVNFFHIDQVREFARDDGGATSASALSLVNGGATQASYSYQAGYSATDDDDDDGDRVLVPDSDDERGAGAENMEDCSFYSSDGTACRGSIISADSEEEPDHSGLGELEEAEGEGQGPASACYRVTPLPQRYPVAFVPGFNSRAEEGGFRTPIQNQACRRITPTPMPRRRALEFETNSTWADFQEAAGMMTSTPLSVPSGRDSMSSIPSSSSTHRSRILESDMDVNSSRGSPTPSRLEGCFIFATPLPRTPVSLRPVSPQEVELPPSAVSRFIGEDGDEDDEEDELPDTSVSDISMINDSWSDDDSVTIVGTRVTPAVQREPFSEDEDDYAADDEVSGSLWSRSPTSDLSGDDGVDNSTPLPQEDADVILCEETLEEEDATSEEDEDSMDELSEEESVVEISEDEEQASDIPNEIGSQLAPAPLPQSSRMDPGSPPTNQNGSSSSSSEVSPALEPSHTTAPTTTAAAASVATPSSSQNFGVLSTLPLPSFHYPTTTTLPTTPTYSAVYLAVREKIQSCPDKTDIYLYLAYRSDLIPELCKLSDEEWVDVSNEFGHFFGPVYSETVELSRDYPKQVARICARFNIRNFTF